MAISKKIGQDSEGFPIFKRDKDNQITEEKVKECIMSLADNICYLLQNRQCCDIMLEWLVEGFSQKNENTPSLAILGGRNGARLTHSHDSQYSYVLQSLSLWREVLHEFFRLFDKLADSKLL